MTQKLKLLDLFSGIGGFSLGLERTGGFETVAFCEIEDFPRRVLAKNWPEVPCYEDVRTLTAERLTADGITVDAICGGFPCQDISFAGKGAGLDGERSGLWREYARLISELRPEVVFVENVAALLSRGLCTVLGGLAEIGYDAEWHCVRASAVGLPHRRDRLWIVAYPECSRRQRLIQDKRVLSCARAKQPFTGYDTAIDRLELATRECRLRGSDGLPLKSHRDKIGSYGNAVVPQIPELLGNAYLKSMMEDAA